MLNAMCFTNLKAAKKFRRQSPFGYYDAIIKRSDGERFQVCKPDIAQALVAVGMAVIVLSARPC